MKLYIWLIIVVLCLSIVSARNALTPPGDLLYMRSNITYSTTGSNYSDSWINGSFYPNSTVDALITGNISTVTTEPHDLNGTNHTGNLSSMRVVKDSGDNFVGWLLDSIIDYFYDNYYNKTTTDALIIGNASGGPGGGDSLWEDSGDYISIQSDEPQAINTTTVYYNSTNYIYTHASGSAIYIDYY